MDCATIYEEIGISGKCERTRCKDTEFLDSNKVCNTEKPCAEYMYIGQDGRCTQDVCNTYLTLGKDGKCMKPTCADYNYVAVDGKCKNDGPCAKKFYLDIYGKCN